MTNFWVSLGRKLEPLQNVVFLGMAVLLAVVGLAGGEESETATPLQIMAGGVFVMALALFLSPKANEAGTKANPMTLPQTVWVLTFCVALGVAIAIWGVYQLL